MCIIYILSKSVLISKIAIKSVILELWKCMTNPSVTFSVLFDSSPFGTYIFFLNIVTKTCNQ